METCVSQAVQSHLRVSRFRISFLPLDCATVGEEAGGKEIKSPAMDLVFFQLLKLPLVGSGSDHSSI